MKVTHSVSELLVDSSTETVVSFLRRFNFSMPFCSKLYVKDLVGSVLQTADGFQILQPCDTDSLKDACLGRLDQRPLVSGVLLFQQPSQRLVSCFV